VFDLPPVPVVPPLLVAPPVFGLPPMPVVPPVFVVPPLPVAPPVLDVPTAPPPPFDWELVVHAAANSTVAIVRILRMDCSY
jgi:hypothetical protein